MIMGPEPMMSTDRMELSLGIFFLPQTIAVVVAIQTYYLLRRKCKRSDAEKETLGRSSSKKTQRKLDRALFQRIIASIDSLSSQQFEAREDFSYPLTQIQS